jgi:TPR repeat protein
MCQQGRSGTCGTWVRVLNGSCQADSGQDCFKLATMLEEGRFTKPDPAQAGVNFARACDLGVQPGCTGLARFMGAGGKDVMLKACDKNDGASCFILGSLFSSGYGVPKDPAVALQLFQKSCENGWWRGCGRLGVSYLVGQGTAVNPVLAIASFEKGCQGQNAASCFEAAKFYHSKASGGTNEPLALQRLAQACDLGLKTACQQVESPGRPLSP